MSTKNKNICVVAYAEYYTDARIKAYVNALLDSDSEITIDIFCLSDPYSKKMFERNKRINIYYTGKKYQGYNKFIYILEYLFFLIKTFVAVTFYSAKNRYKVFHVHNQPDIIVFTAILPKIFGAKIILDMHDVLIAGVISKFGHKKGDLFYQLTKFQSLVSVWISDILITADHSQKEFLEENGIKHKNTFVFLNLPDEKYFYPGDLKNQNGRVKLVYHGTISHRLGLDLIVKAVELLQPEVDVSFTIIGSGELKNELIEYCEHKNILDKYIYFKPFIPVEKLQEEIENYDIGIIGNRKTLIAEKCMLPVKLMEYNAIGLPVITPDLEIIKRYFKDNMVVYYKAEDVKDMAEKIKLLAQNPELRKVTSRNGKEFFNFYNWAAQKKDYYNLITSLLK